MRGEGTWGCPADALPSLLGSGQEPREVKGSQTHSEVPEGPCRILLRMQLCRKIYWFWWGRGRQPAEQCSPATEHPGPSHRTPSNSTGGEASHASTSHVLSMSSLAGPSSSSSSPERKTLAQVGYGTSGPLALGSSTWLLSSFPHSPP